VFRLIGNKPRLGAGRPSSLIIVGDSLPVFIGPPPYLRPCSRTLSVMPFRRLLAPRPTRAHSADHLDEQWLAWAWWPRCSVMRATPERSSPLRPLRTQGWMGGFAALEASPRRVAGVSRP